MMLILYVQPKNTKCRKMTTFCSQKRIQYYFRHVYLFFAFTNSYYNTCMQNYTDRFHFPFVIHKNMHSYEFFFYYDIFRRQNVQAYTVRYMKNRASIGKREVRTRDTHTTRQIICVSSLPQLYFSIPLGSKMFQTLHRISDHSNTHSTSASFIAISIFYTHTL